MNDNKAMIITSNDEMLRYSVETGADAVQMKDAVGTEIDVAEIFQYPIEKEGDVSTCTSLVNNDGVVYQTLSPTVDDCVKSIWRIWGERWSAINIKVRITEGKSNNNRKFLTLKVVSWSVIE